VKILDLFCKAGGASRGYQLAGFEVVGVDLEPQKNHIGELFVQAEALSILDVIDLSQFDAIHASPPCQAYSRLAAMHPKRKYPKLIEPTRDKLAATGLPYVIENVEGAPLRDPVILCGSMFGLGAKGGYLRRHRLFETNFPLPQPECAHEGKGRAVGVYGHGGHSGKRRMLAAPDARAAMEIDWMNRDELAQAIPPAYARYVGEHLRRYLGL
jgi:DNA (cytosine-5)-methyltransferase 1